MESNNWDQRIEPRSHHNQIHSSHEMHMGLNPSPHPSHPSHAHSHSLSSGGNPGGIPVYSSPIYVNARQYARILKRREARLLLERKIQQNQPKKRYMHESRHNHACKRPRGSGGRFLTKAEYESLSLTRQSNEEELFPPDSPPQAIEQENLDSITTSLDLISHSDLISNTELPEIVETLEHT